MCILFVYIDNEAKDGYQVIIANNRDEIYARPTVPARVWQDHPHCISGIDMQPGREGGTWFGMSTKGKIACLLSILSPGKWKKSKKGRGFIIRDYLSEDQKAKQFLKDLEKEHSEYNGFNLVLLEKQNNKWHVVYSTNKDSNNPIPIEKDVFALSNSTLEQPWQKTTNGCRQFHDIVNKYNQKRRLRSPLSSEFNSSTNRHSPRIHSGAPENDRHAKSRPVGHALITSNNHRESTTKRLCQEFMDNEYEYCLASEETGLAEAMLMERSELREYYQEDSTVYQDAEQGGEDADQEDDLDEGDDDLDEGEDDLDEGEDDLDEGEDDLDEGEDDIDVDADDLHHVYYDCSLSGDNQLRENFNKTQTAVTDNSFDLNNRSSVDSCYYSESECESLDASPVGKRKLGDPSRLSEHATPEKLRRCSVDRDADYEVSYAIQTEQDKDDMVDEIFDFLSDTTQHMPDAQLDKQAETLSKRVTDERSQIFVHSPTIKGGTMSSTVLLIDSRGRGEYIEKYLESPPTHEVHEPANQKWSWSTHVFQLQD